MVQTRQKGNRSLRRAIEYYEADGWRIDKVEKTGKFIIDKDLFNLFDLVGVKPNKSVYVQVKTNRPPPQKDFLEFSQQYAGTHLFVESYTWYDRKGAKILRYNKNGTITTLDFRK